MKIFVTVGTTSFDKLIESLMDNETLEILRERGYTDVMLQIGRGSFEPCVKRSSGVNIEFFRYKDSITEDIAHSDLVISHAGAGSCLEVLGAGKSLLVVINEDLMSNHQYELAERLHKDDHLLYTTCGALKETLRTMNLADLKQLPAAKTEIFASFLNSVVWT